MATKQFQLGNNSSHVAIVEGEFLGISPFFVISNKQIEVISEGKDLPYEVVRCIAMELAKRMGITSICLLFSRNFPDITMGVIDGFFDAGLLAVEAYEVGDNDEPFLVVRKARLGIDPTATPTPEYGVFQPNESSN